MNEISHLTALVREDFRQLGVDGSLTSNFGRFQGEEFDAEVGILEKKTIELTPQTRSTDSKKKNAYSKGEFY